ALPWVVGGIGGVVVGAVLVGSVAARLGRSRPARAAQALATDLRRGLLVRGVWPKLTLASVLVVAGHTATFVIAARLAGCTAPLGELIALLMVIQIAAAIPLNIGGWGAREGAAAWAFAAAGLGAATGVTVSTLYAVLMLAAVTPGAGLLLKDAVRRRRGREHPGEWSGPDPAPPTRHPAWCEAERLVPWRGRARRQRSGAVFASRCVLPMATQPRPRSSPSPTWPTRGSTWRSNSAGPPRPGYRWCACTVNASPVTCSAASDATAGRNCAKQSSGSPNAAGTCCTCGRRDGASGCTRSSTPTRCKMAAWTRTTRTSRSATGLTNATTPARPRCCTRWVPAASRC